MIAGITFNPDVVALLELDPLPAPVVAGAAPPPVPPVRGPVAVAAPPPPPDEWAAAYVLARVIELKEALLALDANVADKDARDPYKWMTTMSVAVARDPATGTLYKLIATNEGSKKTPSRWRREVTQLAANRPDETLVPHIENNHAEEDIQAYIDDPQRKWKIVKIGATREFCGTCQALFREDQKVTEDKPLAATARSGGVSGPPTIEPKPAAADGENDPYHDVAPIVSVQEFAERCGWLPEHVANLSKSTRDSQSIKVFRASRAGSVARYYGQDRFMAKLAEFGDHHTAVHGVHEGLVEDQQKLTTDKSELVLVDITRNITSKTKSNRAVRMNKQGEVLLDREGKEIPINGKLRKVGNAIDIVDAETGELLPENFKAMYADADPQGYYGLKDGKLYLRGRRTFDSVEALASENRAIVGEGNQEIIMHADEATYNEMAPSREWDTVGRAFRSKRIPYSNETYGIADERGVLRFVRSPKDLAEYLERRGLDRSFIEYLKQARNPK